MLCVTAEKFVIVKIVIVDFEKLRYNSRVQSLQTAERN